MKTMIMGEGDCKYCCYCCLSVCVCGVIKQRYDTLCQSIETSNDVQGVKDKHVMVVFGKGNDVSF